MSSIALGLLERSASEALGFGIGTTLGRALEPEAVALAQAAFADLPVLALDPQTAAIGAAKGQIPHDTAQAEAAKGGINGTNFGYLIKAVRDAPGVGELLELARRTTINRDELREGLIHSQIAPEWVDHVMELTRVLLSPADLAMMRQQQFISPAEQVSRSALQGVTAPDAELLYQVSGLPPGVETGLVLLRRGVIDGARFAQIVAEGHTKTKYTPDLLALQDVPVTTALAAEAVIRERITLAEGMALAHKNGTSSESFSLIVETGGRPISIGEALTLLNRGEYTQADVENVVARSNVRPEFTPDILKLRIHYPPLFQVQRALANGTITKAIAHDTLTKEGYPAEWVDAIVNAGSAAKTAKHKELTLALVEDLYGAGLETRAQATTRLEALGYDAAEVDELLNLHDARREVAAINRAISVTGARYIAHQIDQLAARAALEAIPVNATAVSFLLKEWTIARQANARTLTAAEVGQAYKYEGLSRDEAKARWVLLGYSSADAELKAIIVDKGPPHPPTAT